MIDLAILRAAFVELESLTPLAVAASGQKQVLRANRDGVDVVLKVFRPGEHAEVVTREIGSVAKLNCDYVPTVLDSGSRRIGAENRLYLVEPYIEGESYRERLQKESKPSLEFVINLARVLLRACCDFEAQGIVHRDLKPENILVGVDGKIWIIDFGIVRILDATSITATHAPFGKFTLGYGAPEQMRNIKTQIDVRADLFSIGVILYESLSGAHPFCDGRRNFLEIVHQLANENLPPLALSGAQPFADLVMSLSARFPSRRPQSAQQALAWFHEATANQSP